MKFKYLFIIATVFVNTAFGMDDSVRRLRENVFEGRKTGKNFTAYAAFGGTEIRSVSTNCSGVVYSVVERDRVKEYYTTTRNRSGVVSIVKGRDSIDVDTLSTLTSLFISRYGYF